MNKRKEERDKRLAEAFEEKYGDILRSLARMPGETSEDREGRWSWFRSLPEYEALFMKAMEAYSPSGYRALIRCMKSGQLTDAGSGKENGIGSEEFLLAVKDTVERYTEEKKAEEGCFFISCIGTRYRQNMQRSCGKARYDQNGPLPKVPDNRKYLVTRFVYKARELAGRRGIKERSCNWEMIFEEIMSSEKQKLTRKEWDAAFQMVINANAVVSTDEAIGDEEDGVTLEDLIADHTERAEEKTQREMREELLGRFLRNMAEDWGYVRCATNKRSREWIRVFLTKDILMELKLDVIPEITEDERKRWEDYRTEPNCGQWCPRRKRCVKSRKTGCYVRYQRKPAGTQRIYKILEPYASVIFHDLMFDAYVNRAIEGEPGDLYEVYANYLKDDFDFSDKLLGEVIHKDKTAVSRARADYEGKVKGELYRQFLDEMGE